MLGRGFAGRERVEDSVGGRVWAEMAMGWGVEVVASLLVWDQLWVAGVWVRVEDWREASRVFAPRVAGRVGVAIATESVVAEVWVRVEDWKEAARVFAPRVSGRVGVAIAMVSVVELFVV